MTENKKAHPIKSDELYNKVNYILSCISDLSLPLLTGMELAPYFQKTGIGCQGFNGPLPSAFLDK